ncbi:MAG: metallophosphoesterase [Bacteroidetes bacterium]|nr:metallophosphoesterase [Bacteroidota bacterium]
MDCDIIGDIHGHAEELESLLIKLGYRKNHGVYSHPEKRKVIFVGDFIDRGPKIRETVHLVKDMCDSGNAEAVMGNQEWNAICFHTPHLERGGFFRDHNLKEIEQHIETLRQFKSYENEWQAFLDWFQVLPLFLDKDEFRVVHACWDNEHIDWLKQNYKGISPEFLGLATNKTNPVESIELLMKH